MIEVKTTEFQIAETLGDCCRVYADLIREGHKTPDIHVTALSIDGCMRTAVATAVQYDATIVQFGSLGGCYNTSEQEALAEFRKQVALWPKQ